MISLQSTGAAAATFDGPAGREHHVTVESEPGLPFAQALELVQQRYEEILRRLAIEPESVVFRRVFVSDVLNQIEQVRDSALAREPAGSPAAVSIVQQAPLNGGKVALLAYHVAGGAALRKRRLSDHHLLVERNGVRRLWSTGLCAGAVAPEAVAGPQTQAVFDNLTGALAAEGANLADHCVRTWLYVKDVDVFYSGMVRARTALFDDAGLTRDTHYIASTGIQGACGHAYDVVAMDAFSQLDLAPGQLSYLNDLDRLCLTKDYGVTFERGARLAYAERAHLLISGTASIDASGQVVHLGDVLAQLDRALENVEALLRAGRGSLADMTHLIVYLRDPSDYADVRERLDGRLPDLPKVFVHGPVCRPEWLVEVEGLAIVANDEPGLPGF